MVGTTISHYKVLEKICEGGMGGSLSRLQPAKDFAIKYRLYDRIKTTGENHEELSIDQ